MYKKLKYTHWLSIYPIHKKIFFMSKIIIVACVLAYSIASAFSDTVGSFVFLSLLLCIILGWDIILMNIVAKPIHEISLATQRMAHLDFSKPCQIETKGELQTLSENLNIASANLQHALLQRKELSDTLSHELKTPLGIIQAYAEGLKDAMPEKQAEYSQVIIEETEKMAEMINALLDLSALEAGASIMKVEKIDIVELVERVAGREYIDGPAKEFSVSYTLPEEPVYIMADAKRLRQVLHNFMGNGKKFVVEKGTIHISVHVLEGNVKFTVYNDGPHLTEEVWNKFYRDKSEKNKNGSGLGLAITEKILSMHKAEYGMKNKKNGVEFFFVFPGVK